MPTYKDAPEGWWREFIMADPPRTAKAAVVRKDGSPHVVPVGVILDGDEIVYTMQKDSVKGRSLQRDGRIALLWDDERPPFSFVLVRGRATLDENVDELRRWTARIGGRYHGKAREEEFSDRFTIPNGVVVRVKIEQVVARVDLSDTVNVKPED
ncbi:MULTISPECIES: PPOX class F420-dependent oxidoreductase [unclassified Streptomyces]|uniref:PPOX class F420-dependent oxidoreductase n=1 Tax=unclassified Streptomyces TaxID=2593676 RepID=UPI00093A9AE7|nr:MULTISPECIES: PPOX class F420-dependent oxidoreductase [unclassified Streptomyces]MBP2585763.1 PPOX class probable F420-dependent enzyme [Streptomyces sp. PvR006]MCX5229788.1 PPOX class F420-dependent oxidoreductase [Streptomyces sp. NBC_00233]OKJ62856.1 pyridoxamine 5'-phosphate oxidase [Streptomyces sp. CB02009]